MATQTANKIGEADALTNENIVRDMTEEELAQFEIDKANRAIAANEIEEHKKAKEAVFAKLGLTPEEVALLLA